MNTSGVHTAKGLTRRCRTVHYGTARTSDARAFEEIVLAFISSPKARDRPGLRVTFARAALVYWAGVFPRVCAHIARWERLAARIPDPELRGLALRALREKRTNIEGACAFAALAPRARRAQVTLALSSFQAAYNLLDMLGEQPSADPVADGRRLHEALPYALDTTRRGLDWYEHHPKRDDAGYLDRLLQECRRALTGLPRYELTVPLARAAAERIVAFQSLNLSEAQGDHTALQQWAQNATPADSGLQWWETAAAAGSSLVVYALIAAAAHPDLDAHDARALERAYFPWIGGLHSLLDNLIDKHEDEAAGHRSLVEYYGPERAAQRMRWLAERAFAAARDLPQANGHTVILVGMVGSYLSAPQVRAAPLATIAGAVLGVCGALIKPTLLVFKLRRLLVAEPAPPAPHAPACPRAVAPGAPATARLDNFG
jgi:tetraprenyl-beta-curcumene synthase